MWWWSPYYNFFCTSPKKFGFLLVSKLPLLHQTQTLNLKSQSYKFWENKSFSYSEPQNPPDPKKLCWRPYSVQYGNWYKLTLAALQVFFTSSIMSSTMMAILLLTSPTTYKGGRSYHHHAIQVSVTFLYSLSVLRIRIRMFLRLLYHQAKIVRKSLTPTVLWLLYDLLSLKNDVNVAWKRNKMKNFI